MCAEWGRRFSVCQGCCLGGRRYWAELECWLMEVFAVAFLREVRIVPSVWPTHTTWCLRNNKKKKPQAKHQLHINYKQKWMHRVLWTEKINKAVTERLAVYLRNTGKKTWVHYVTAVINTNIVVQQSFLLFFRLVFDLSCTHTPV